MYYNYIGLDFENDYSQNGNFISLLSNNENYNYNYHPNIDNNSIYNQKKSDMNNGLEKTTQINTNEENIFQTQKKEEIKQTTNLDQNLQKINIDIEKSTEIKNKNKSINKKCGRKRKNPDINEDNQIEHNKFSNDNMRRKCKHLVLHHSLQFINSQINKIYKGKIGVGVYKKELKTINQSQKSDATITFNKLFLNKTLGDIFSEDISGRYTNLPSNHNKLIINNLMNEEDENKRLYFSKLFNITFIECLKHFINQVQIKELKGMKCFSDIKKDLLCKFPDEGEDYVESLSRYFENYFDLITNERPRKSRKKINNILENKLE